MPHLKVVPFDTSVVKNILPESNILTFHAKNINNDDEMFGIMHENEEFLLQLKLDTHAMLLKYDKVTRPLKVNLIKEALLAVSLELELDVLSSNITMSNTRPKLSLEYLKKIEDFENISYPKEKICIEIGFGSGRHLLYQAKKNTDTLFIGLEIHTPSAQQVLKQITLQELDNIWIVNYDARLFLEILPSNIFEKIFVHFPVPWDKKPWRRVIGKDFIDESMRVLSKNGHLELRTDSYKYFWYALEVFLAEHRAEVKIQKNESIAVVSKYEERWKKQNKDIYNVHLECKETSKIKKIELDFNFNIVKYKKSLENRLSTETMVFDGYFVHFEQLYKTESGMLLIKCAFGGFDRPEHKYIIFNDTSCRYFGSSPVKTNVNYRAHQKIVELLNG